MVRLGSLGELFPGGGAKRYGFMLSLAAAVIPSQPSGLFELAPRGLICLNLWAEKRSGGRDLGARTFFLSKSDQMYSSYIRSLTLSF